MPIDRIDVRLAGPVGASVPARNFRHHLRDEPSSSTTRQTPAWVTSRTAFSADGMPV
jgi:hypothetical protein